MDSWTLAALLSPWLAMSIVAIVVLATTAMSFLAAESFWRLGLSRVARGYAGSLLGTVLLALSIFALGQSTWPDIVGIFLFLGYIDCLIVALFLVPIAVAATKRRFATAPWLLVGSVLVGIVLIGLGRMLRGPGIGDGSPVRFWFDLGFAIAYPLLVSLGFVIGARLPWRAVH
jgi:hypothetical protein